MTFSLVSSNLMSIFSPNIGHQEKIISKSETKIIQLNIFNESHLVATFWFSSKIRRPKSFLNARGSFYCCHQLSKLDKLIGEPMHEEGNIGSDMNLNAFAYLSLTTLFR